MLPEPEGGSTGESDGTMDCDKLLCAVNWMRICLPVLLSVISPLRALLGELTAGPKRTKRLASTRDIREVTGPYSWRFRGYVVIDKCGGEDDARARTSTNTQGGAIRGVPSAGRLDASRTKVKMALNAVYCGCSYQIIFSHEPAMHSTT